MLTDADRSKLFILLKLLFIQKFFTNSTSRNSRESELHGHVIVHALIPSMRHFVM
jgi:hypothetical protein